MIAFNRDSLCHCPFMSYRLILKGTVQRDFRPAAFFITQTSRGPLTNRLKYFRFWLRIRQVIQILSSKILLPGV